MRVRWGERRVLTPLGVFRWHFFADTSWARRLPAWLNRWHVCKVTAHILCTQLSAADIFHFEKISVLISLHCILLWHKFSTHTHTHTHAQYNPHFCSTF